MQRIVVGVDGSPPSVEALRWAVGEAAAHGAELVAVAAWEFPFVPSGPGAGFYVGPTAEDLTNDAVAQLDEAFRQVDATGVEVTRLTEYGSPSQVLLEQSEGADLLVVGARGHGGFTGLLIGSVSQQCATHAVVPTVVVPMVRGTRENKRGPKR